MPPLASLHTLAEKGKAEELVRQLDDPTLAKDINAENAVGKTPLHIACENGKESVVQQICTRYGSVHAVGQQPKLDVADSRGWLPIHYAVSKKHLRIVMLLHVADPSLLEKLVASASGTQDDDGQSVLHVCAHASRGRRATPEMMHWLYHKLGDQAERVLADQDARGKKVSHVAPPGHLLHAFVTGGAHARAAQAQAGFDALQAINVQLAALPVAAAMAMPIVPAPSPVPAPAPDPFALVPLVIRPIHQASTLLLGEIATGGQLSVPVGMGGLGTCLIAAPGVGKTHALAHHITQLQALQSMRLVVIIDPTGSVQHELSKLGVPCRAYGFGDDDDDERGVPQNCASATLVRPLDQLNRTELAKEMLLGVVRTDAKGVLTLESSVLGLPVQTKMNTAQGPGFSNKAEKADLKVQLALAIHQLANETIRRAEKLGVPRKEFNNPRTFVEHFSKAMQRMEWQGQGQMPPELEDYCEPRECSLPAFEEQDLLMVIKLLKLCKPKGDDRLLFSHPAPGRFHSLDLNAMRADDANAANIVVVNLCTLDMAQKELVAANLLEQVAMLVKSKNGEQETPSTALIIDEAHDVISNRNQRAAALYAHMLQTTRSKGLQLVCASQKPDDLDEKILQMTTGPRIVAGVGGDEKVEKKVISLLCKRQPGEKRQRDWTEKDRAEAQANTAIIQATRTLGRHQFILLPELTGERAEHTVFSFPANTGAGPAAANAAGGAAAAAAGGMLGMGAGP